LPRKADSCGFWTFKKKPGKEIKEKRNKMVDFYEKCGDIFLFQQKAKTLSSLEPKRF
jgi:hypothetical protein